MQLVMQLVCNSNKCAIMPRTSQGTRTNRKTKPETLPVKFSAGFLSALDGRTELAKALRANYDSIIEDIGGLAEVGHIKASLIERFVWLEGILQSIEHEMAQGNTSKTEAIGRWIQAVNSLTGLAKVLGIERRSSAKPWIIPASDDSAGNLEDK